MKIHIDYERCTGHGFCEGIDDEVFEVRADGVAHLLHEDVADDETRERVADAVAQCPTRALSTSD